MTDRVSSTNFTAPTIQEQEENDRIAVHNVVLRLVCDCQASNNMIRQTDRGKKDLWVVCSERDRGEISGPCIDLPCFYPSNPRNVVRSLSNFRILPWNKLPAVILKALLLCALHFCCCRPTTTKTPFVRKLRFPKPYWKARKKKISLATGPAKTRAPWEQMACAEYSLCLWRVILQLFLQWPVENR